MKSNLKLAVDNSVRIRPNQRFIRRFVTTYAGIARQGYCNSRESAIEAAVGHILEDGYSKCTITDRHTGLDIAWLELSRDRKAVRVTTVTIIQKVRK